MATKYATNPKKISELPTAEEKLKIIERNVEASSGKSSATTTTTTTKQTETTPKTTTAETPQKNMQKKKEDALEEKNQVDSEQIKKDRIKEEYAEAKEKLDESKKEIMKVQSRGQMVQNSPNSMNNLLEEQKKLAARELQLRAANDQIVQEEQEAADAAVTAKNLQTLSTLSEAEKKKLDQYINKKLYLKSGGYVKAELPAELVRKFGAERTAELAETYWRQKNAETAQKFEEAGATHANKHPVLSNIATVPINIGAGIVGAAGQAADADLRTGQYQTLDPNAAGTEYQRYSNAIRGQTAQNIEGEDPNGWRKAASIAYQGGMSLLDSTVQAATLGGAGAALVAGANTFSQTLSDASAAGATPEQAVTYATSAAAIEAISEKLPMDNLADAFKGSKKKGMELLKQAALNAGIEMTTEELSFAGSFIAELVILKEKSSYKQDITKGILSGLSPAEAVAQANKNVEQEALNTAMISAISGGGSHIVANAFAGRGRNNVGTETKPGEVAKTREDLEKRYGQQAEQQTTATETPLQPVQTPQQSQPIQQQTAENQPVAPAQQPTVQETPAQAAQPVQQATQTAQMPQTTQEQTAPPTVSSIVADAVRKAQETGSLSNGDANKILNNPVAVAELERQAGAKITGTNAEKRATVKDIVKQMVEQQNAANTTQEANQSPVQTENQPQTQQVEQQNKPNAPQETAQQAQTEEQQPTQTETAPQAQQAETVKEETQEAPQVRTQSEDTYTGVQQRATERVTQPTDSAQQTETKTKEPELQRDRVNAVREQEVTKTDPQGGVVSEFAGNAYQSALTPDSFTDSIKRLVSEGEVSHDVQTNEQSLQKGAELIAEAKTEREAVEKLRDYANKGETSPEYIAMGVVLYQDLTAQIEQQQKSGKVDPNIVADAENVFVSLQQMATTSGRALQLFNLFRKMSPESQTRVMEKEVQRGVEKLQKEGIVKKGYKAELPQDLVNDYRSAAQEFQKAKTPEAKKAAEQKMADIQNVIYMETAAKMPTTFKAKWDAWRYMAMLGNVKTQFRNFMGNTLMMPYTDAKRVVGAVLEKGINKDNRTKAVFQDRELLKWAKQDAKTAAVNATLKGSAKTGDTAKSVIAENIKTFGDGAVGELLNAAEKGIGNIVSGTDLLYKNHEYAASLAGFLKARGYSGADIQNQTIPQDVLNEARNYAVQEALKATFNDSNALSDTLANARFKNPDDPVKKALNMLGEGVMPFRKTPANIVMRFKDYSPAGLLQGVWNMALNVRNGKVSAATAIDQISSGLVGTAAMQFGYMLANGLFGVKLTGSEVGEDEERQGHQKYALEFSVNGQEYSYKIDWTAPANLPLFLGANIRAMQEAPDTASFLTATANAALGVFEPLLELSCLSSLNDLVESAKYAEEGEEVYSILSKAATSYLTQGVPSLARQATQAATENKQTTFITSDDPFTQKIQKAAAGLGVGNQYKTDKVNAWGEKEKQGAATADLPGISEKAARAVDAFVNPGTLKKIDNSALEQEISRLNKAQEENVSPSYIPKTISYTDKDGTLHKDHRLTEDEYQQLAQIQGQTAQEVLTKMIETTAYKGMDDSMKAKAMQMAYDYARQKAMKETFGTTYDSSWMLGAVSSRKATNTILREVADNSLNSALSKIKEGRKNNYSKENIAAYEKELDKSYAAFAKMPATQKAKVMESATGTTKKFLEAKAQGVTTQQFLGVTAKIDRMNDPSNTQKWEAIADATMTEAGKDAMMKAFMDDYNPNAKTVDTTELKYEYARNNMELTASEFVDAKQAYDSQKKKRDKINAMVDAGFDKDTATELYKLFYGSMKQTIIDLYG